MSATLSLKSFLIDAQEKNEHIRKVPFVIRKTGLEDCATQGKIHDTWQHLKRIRQRRQASTMDVNNFGNSQTPFLPHGVVGKSLVASIDNLVLF